MDSVDLQVIRTARDWVGSGRRVVLATVIRTWGSAPRPIGALSAIRDDGMVVGSVSGGCVEDDMITRVKAGTLAENTPTTTKYGVSAEEAQRFGLPCGGTLELVLEPLTAASGLDDLLSRIERHELVLRRLDMKTGRATTGPAQWSDQLAFDGATLTTVYGPRWRLLIIGAGQLSTYLAQMAQALDYQVTVCDPRQEYSETWSLPGVELKRGMPDDVVTALNLDGHSAVVTLTHDPKLDDMALLEALKSPAFYIGAIGSRKNNDARRQRLAEFDLSQAEIARLHGPVGLKIGSRTPPEIAVAILAEMTAIRNGVDIKRFVEPPKATTAGCAVD
ncbi:MAG: XdhC family protein [Burkholderiales bacterium]|nr:XdhC family protein [Burkholderiales bacterium]